MSLNRREVVSFLALSGFASVAAADSTYPNRPVKILVPYPAGGPFDVVAREVARNFQSQWGQPVVVDYKPGANEILCAETLAKSRPDGYTMMLSSESSTVLNPLLYKKLPYNAQSELRALARIANAPFVLVTKASFPAKTLPEFIALAKSQPGKINFGSAGLGNPSHLGLAMMERKYGIKVTHVPYKGAAPVLQDVLSGAIDISFFPVSVIEPHVRSGALRAMAISGNTRVSALPSTPTFQEAGVADVSATFYFQMVVPAATPEPVAKKVRDQLQKVIADAEFQKKFVEPYGLEPVVESEQQFARFREQDAQVQTEKVKAAGVTLDF